MPGLRGRMKKLPVSKKFLAIDVLFEGGRMFVGATSVTYLLHTGMSFADIASLKSIQALVMITGEVPTGILADSFGRKTSLVISGLCAIAGFLLYYASSTFMLFALAEILTALALCFWSGAFESSAIDMMKEEKDECSVSQFFHLNNAFNSLAVMTFGLLGGYLGSKGLNFPYLGAIVCYLVMFGIMSTLPKETHIELLKGETWTTKMRHHLKAAFKEGLLHPALLPFFLVNIAIQFLIQPLLHYWQPFFQTIDGSISSSDQGLIFSSYCAVTAIFSFGFAKVCQKDWAKKPLTIALIFGVFSLLYIALSLAGSLGVAFVLFALLQGTLSLCRTSLSIKMNEVIDSSSRSSILSSLSLFSRFGMITSLALIGKFVDQSNQTGISSVYKNYGLLTFGLILLLIAGLVLMNRKKAEVYA